MRSSDEIIDYLNTLRQQQGVSISELARRVGMAKSGVSRYFNHTREFPINRAPEFAKALHVKVEELLGVDEFEKDNSQDETSVDLDKAHAYSYRGYHVPDTYMRMVKGLMEQDIKEGKIKKHE